MTEETVITVPDIGGAHEVEVIEVLVHDGETIAEGASLITLESDKASMEIPSTLAGKVLSIMVKVGDKVSEGSPIVKLAVAKVAKPETQAKEETSPLAEGVHEVEYPTIDVNVSESNGIYAGPAVRRLARELGVDLSFIKGSARKGRITREDLIHYFKSQSHGFSKEALPAIDFSQFGPIETKPLNKIKRLTAAHMTRAWHYIPHVTQFDTADITELEAFRQAHLEEAKAESYKLTLLAFVVKAATKLLAMYPAFNASLDASGENLIYKQYYHIGIAVDTPNGLVVPVIKDAQNLSVKEIALAMQQLSLKARDKALTPGDLKGGSFTISSLGGIGGVGFTPIVNLPEVAILGLSRSLHQPVFQKGSFVPRLILPFSLSYDHRVIDGAEGARFTRDLSQMLSEMHRILL